MEQVRNAPHLLRYLKTEERRQGHANSMERRGIASRTSDPTVVKHDGGRITAGFKGTKTIGDCVCRAITIAAEQPYAKTHADLSDFGWSTRQDRYSWRDKDGLIIPGAMARWLERQYIEPLGLVWRPLPAVKGQPRPRPRDLLEGRLIASMRRHLVAVVDGVVYDTWDSLDQPVYGYYHR
jgi:hypothetical protein